MMPTGTVRVAIGTAAHGQGHATTFSQTVADQLGVEYEDVEVIYGDTQLVPLGLDTYGSRSMAVGGIAIHHAGEKIIAKARTLAAHQLECSEDDLEWTPGTFTVRGTDRSADIKTLAFAAWSGHDLPDGFEPGLTATHIYDPPNFSWPHGAHACVVEVDTETGLVDIVRYVAVDDCGVQINPMLVAGQVHGGVAQGIAEALYEEARYDEEGNLLHGTMTTYMIPAAPELPSFELDHTVTPSPTNPLGVKGIGEAARSPPPRGDRRGRGRPLPPRRHGHRAAGDPGEGLEGDPGGAVMIPTGFDYEVAESTDHALELLRTKEDAKLIAGGHSLLPLMKLRLAQPGTLVDIGRVSELRGVRMGATTWRSGRPRATTS